MWTYDLNVKSVKIYNEGCLDAKLTWSQNNTETGRLRIWNWYKFVKMVRTLHDSYYIRITYTRTSIDFIFKKRLSGSQKWTNKFTSAIDWTEFTKKTNYTYDIWYNKFGIFLSRKKISSDNPTTLPILPYIPQNIDVALFPTFFERNQRRHPAIDIPLRTWQRSNGLSIQQH